MKIPRHKPVYVLTWVTDQLAVGQAPMSHAQLDAIRDQGIDAILNLCGEFCDLHDIEHDAGFEVRYLPLQDEEAPGLQELEKTLAWLDEAIYLGKKVLIHCRHGIGRTGTVLNAYLLRRGLGHMLAYKTLRKLKSKPANFNQWRTIRKYGKSSGKLTVREPCLEFKRLVDLSPFLNDYEGLVQTLEDMFPSESGQRCGRDHDRCCSTPIKLTLAEAVHLSRSINMHLTSQQRLDVIERAVETARKERQTARDFGPEGESTEYCLSQAGAVCPLLEEGTCLLFAQRPLQCRSYDMEAGQRSELWDSNLAPGLTRLSQEIYFAYVGTLPGDNLPKFALPDVVSGKFMEAIFRFMMDN